ncbi:E3 ubiquitin-protein ligase TRIM71-like [Lingula anatina]|uniref:E3 ubiquitin-protein ligase TRIM71-like n=1 Tax=Lingula anatina TaxID=7574 RepID=A0A1S3JCI1_LINAN|nr:E3 ubiquitin-protein ligase TRIM71-like [Lingula anatina]|eukprot:XP_013408107.1 E3 ubiquitin-protein ligase TRIM71-like [Lingula anatina]
MQEQSSQELVTDKHCKKHPSEPLAFYCENDGSVICEECVAEFHSKHDFKKLSDVVKVQRDQIQEHLKCLPHEKLSRFEKAEEFFVRTQEKLTENQTRILRQVDSQRLSITMEIEENRKTLMEDLAAYYQQVEQDVRAQTDDYLADVKQHLEAYEAKVLSDFSKLQRLVDNESNNISAEVKAFTSAQMKTLEVEKDKQERKKICFESIRHFALQLIDTGSDIDVLTHAKNLEAKMLELQATEPSFDTKALTSSLTPGPAKTEHTVECPELPEPGPLSVKTGSITAKIHWGPLDACFGSLKPKSARRTKLQIFQKPTWLDTPKETLCFPIMYKPWDITCTDDECILILRENGVFVAVHSNTGQLTRVIRIEGEAYCITATSNDMFVASCRDKCCRLYSTSGQVIQCFGEGDMSRPWGVTVDRTEGKVFVCDSGTKCICVYDTESFNLVNKIAIPMCTCIALQCEYHHGIKAVIVLENSAHCVYAVTPGGDVLFQYGARGQSVSEEGRLSQPFGVCVDKFRHIFIADCCNHKVLVLGSDGKYIRNVLTRKHDNIVRPMRVAVNRNGELVVGTNECAVFTFSYIDKI